nr:venom peptide [Acharia stimulea]
MYLRLVVLAAVGVLAHGELVEMSCTLIKLTVDGHNMRRELVAKGQLDGQPAATDMKCMIWDEELAKKAADWASRNKFEHDSDGTVPSGRFRINQHVYVLQTIDKSHEFDMEAALEMWFEENKDYKYEPISSRAWGPSTGHYTQMVWSKTTRVGCAVSEFMQNEMKNIIIICNYGPAGNIVHQYPYSTKGNKPGKLKCSKEDSQNKYGSKC